MMKTEISNQNQMNKLKDFIQDELLKRGFTAKISYFGEVSDKNGSKFEFITEEFQTTPVIFKSIFISNFSSSITEEEIERPDGSKITVHKVWISVHVSYKHFGGGSNGCNLFDVAATMYEDDIFDFQIG